MCTVAVGDEDVGVIRREALEREGVARRDTSPNGAETAQNTHSSNADASYDACTACHGRLPSQIPLQLAAVAPTMPLTCL